VVSDADPVTARQSSAHRSGYSIKVAPCSIEIDSSARGQGRV